MRPKQLRPPNESPSINIPPEPLKAVFTGEVLDAWSKATSRSESLQHRLDVLTACGPLPYDEHNAHRIKWLRAWRAAWEVYTEAAFACGMLGGDRDAELRSKLTRLDDDNFRSAMSECMSCWFLAGRMGMQVDGVAKGRPGKMLDMRVVLPDGEAGVEVKAPFRRPPRGTGVWWGNDADKIRQCLVSANKQLDKDRVNILVIAPDLRIPMFYDRGSLLQACYGESVIAFGFNDEEGGLTNPRSEFRPRGKFLNTERPGGEPLKPDGFPAYRRVSAVLCIEERVCETHVAGVLG